MCYNCGGRGHTSRQCLSDAFFCEIRKSISYCGRKKPARQLFCCEGLVEGQFVNDIVLDTGCSRTLVRGDLVRLVWRGLLLCNVHMEMWWCTLLLQWRSESSFCGGSGVRQAATFSVVEN